MKGLLVFIGVVCFIAAGKICYSGVDIYTDASTIMQQELGMQFILYSGLLLLCGMFGISRGIE